MNNYLDEMNREIFYKLFEVKVELAEYFMWIILAYFLLNDGQVSSYSCFQS